jgi:hypothetical protein
MKTLRAATVGNVVTVVRIKCLGIFRIGYHSFSTSIQVLVDGTGKGIIIESDIAKSSS